MTLLLAIIWISKDKQKKKRKRCKKQEHSRISPNDLGVKETNQKSEGQILFGQPCVFTEQMENIIYTPTLWLCFIIGNEWMTVLGAKKALDLRMKAKQSGLMLQTFEQGHLDWA